METFLSQMKTIAVEVFTPSTLGKYPAIVIAYGTEGMGKPWDDQIRDFASNLATDGYVALIPHYFDSTGTTPGLATVFAAFPATRDTWVQTIDDALKFANSHSGVQAGKLGSVGFSLGGHLVLRQSKLGSGSQAIGAVVDFFGPIAQLGGLDGNIDKLPPVQIHHGDADPLVFLSESQGLVTDLNKAGKTSGTDYEFYVYPKEGHGFKDATNITTSKQRTVKFFDNHVK